MIHLLDVRRCGAVLLSAALAFAQAVNGTLLGTINDSSGAAVPGAKVVITETNTGVSRTATTNQSGNYTFPDLPPGTYTVSVEQPGFKKTSRAGVDVLVNSAVRVDLTLQPGEVSETIDVTAEAPMLQTERADTGRKVETKQIEDLPVSTQGGRNFQALLNLVPGTTKALPAALGILQSTEQPVNTGERPSRAFQQSSARRYRR